MRWPVSMRHLLPPRLPRAAMSIFASIGGCVVRDRKFPDVVRTFRGNRRDESSSRNSPAKRTTARLAKTNCKQSGSRQFQNLKATRGRVRTLKASQNRIHVLNNFARSALECGESSHRFGTETRLQLPRIFSGEANATVSFGEELLSAVSPKRKSHLRPLIEPTLRLPVVFR